MITIIIAIATGIVLRNHSSERGKRRRWWFVREHQGENGKYIKFPGRLIERDFRLHRLKDSYQSHDSTALDRLATS